MNQKGSVFIMFLWVMILFSVFALSVAFRTRLATKIRSFEDRTFQMEQNSFNALNLARFFLDSDESPDLDSRLDKWYGVPQTFKDLPFADMFGLKIEDEESKIDLNRVTPEILLSVVDTLKSRGVRIQADSKDLVSRLMAWRGTPAGFGKPFMGSDMKEDFYESLDELFIVPGIKENDALLLMPYLTVFGKPGGKRLQVNLNTVHPYVLEGLIRAFPGDERNKQILFKAIEDFRKAADREQEVPSVFGYDDLTPGNLIEKLRLSNTPVMQMLAGHLLVHVTLDSQLFHVSIYSRGSQAPSGKEQPYAEAVIGPLTHRVSHIHEEDIETIAQTAYSVIPRMEVLSWHENIIRNPAA